MSQLNEYDFDSSDEEDVQNTIGNIPIQWYDNSSHMGYDISGRPLLKPSDKGAVDNFLDNVENKNKGLVIRDPYTGQNVILSENDIRQIKGICSSRGFLSSKINEDDFVNNWFTKDVMETPLTAHPPQKRSFIPSLLDKKRVSRMIYAIKMGRMKMPEVEDEDKILDSDHDFIANMDVPDVWRNDYNKRKLKNVGDEYLEWLPKELHPDYQTKYQGLRQIIRPPPQKLPGHEESYNPPKEYLLSDKERKLMISRFYDPSYNPCKIAGEKPLIPKIYSNLRTVPYSVAPILDKLKRQRDLIYAPRVIKEKVQSSTEKMLKQDIPPISEMRPYPNIIEYNTPVGDIILSVSVSYCGKYVATVGYEFITIYLTRTGVNSDSPLCQRKYSITEFNMDKKDLTIRNPTLAWNPYNLLLCVAVGSKVKIINPDLVGSSIDLEVSMKDWMSSSETKESESSVEPATKKRKLFSNWSLVKPEGKRQLTGLLIELDEPVIDMSWHTNGDYLLTISGVGKATNSGGKVLLHRLSKCASQSPFGDSNKKWLAARFHSQKTVPLLFLAEVETSHIQVYDLILKKQVKTLQVTGKTSTMEMHPKENHLIVGTFEGKICWFDLDMGITPFKTFNVNLNSIRSITISNNYPLMACSTSKGSVVVFYAKVYNTLEDNPVIVPVNKFDMLDKSGDMYSICFHPIAPKLYCGGLDKCLIEINSCH